MKRRMVKGTYEHSDTFIQRDVNPVGIYGRVEIIITEQESMEQEPEISYLLSEDMESARVSAKAVLRGLTPGAEYRMVLKIKDNSSGIEKDVYKRQGGYWEVRTICRLHGWSKWMPEAPAVYPMGFLCRYPLWLWLRLNRLLLY